MNLANQITLARIVLIPLFMISFLNQQSTITALLIFAVAAGTDKLDGYVARKYNQITNLGKLLDPLADKLLIAAALIMMVQENMISSWFAESL
ncbi:CDP-alcohol phosphatidyltransferase family protein [Paenibacillus amylolyticus]|uniref:CDP-alcohol phosphatidyltransferase family protein n=1 Tax=Paenibacillus amylolyticus TaxID=1451 RepID=UPI0026CD7D5D